MTEQWKSPLDAGPWPGKLVARVVSPGCQPRIHGYSVDEDLIHHYGYAHVVTLGFAGRFLDEVTQRALEAGMVAVAAIGVNEAASHAGVLSRVCAARPAATIGIVASMLGQEAQDVTATHDAWLDWLCGRGDAAPPAVYLASTSAEARAAIELEGALAQMGFAVPALSHRPKRAAAALAVWASCGIRRDLLPGLWVVARLPAALAEADAQPELGMRDYPMNVPRVKYTESDR